MESQEARSTRPGGRTARVREQVRAAARAELHEKGLEGLSHRAIALRAGVNATTVYRRWPTRAQLIADLLLDFSDEHLHVPDTGSMISDLTDYLRQIIMIMSRPETRRLAQALYFAASDSDEDVAGAVRAFWRERFNRAALILERAVGRAELEPDCDRFRMIERMIAPAWFRVLISREPTDDEFVASCVSDAITFARLSLR